MRLIRRYRLACVRFGDAGGGHGRAALADEHTIMVTDQQSVVALGFVAKAELRHAGSGRAVAAAAHVIALVFELGLTCHVAPPGSNGISGRV